MRFFHILLLSIIISLGNPISAQSPYELTNSRDIPLVTGGLALNVGLIFIQKAVKPLPDSLIRSLDRLQVNSFDRIATQAFRPKVSKTSDKFVISSVAFPLLLGLGSKGRDDFGQIGVMWFETLAINTLFTSLSKIAARRTRPYAYISDID